MLDDWSATMAEDGGRFLRALLIFNRLPARWAHPGRLVALAPALDEGAASRLLAVPRLHERLSERLLVAASLQTEECWDFPPRRRLALLPPAELRRIARHAGAALHSRSVRNVIVRQARERLIERIGADAYAFAVKRAPFLTMPTERPQRADATEAIETDGLACLGAWLATEPLAVSGRVALGFPPGLALERHEQSIETETGRRMLDLVLKHGDPAWRAYSG